MSACICTPAAAPAHAQRICLYHYSIKPAGARKAIRKSLGVKEPQK